MSDLIERLMSAHSTRPNIPVDRFLALLGEWGAGAITAAQAQEGIAAVSGGVALNPAEQQEANLVAQSVLSIAVAGSAAAVADGKASRALRWDKIERVLTAAGAPPFATAEDVRNALGLP